ncbi:zinc metalloprotease [Virgisporangium aliadipatigenens]|uniref:Zinc metalloprotease n=1 Tax=Virgisporangium aliadipatigenens TaxID=741659 RepID=A0A8J3YMB8_9ACTN|nr:site-2 protease family protein [Virgisporangium aliadipatigenens]GIJ48149.1 zinc metalloprotease [Virgisporangium aliadipatigenens]
MKQTVRMGRVAGIPIGLHWSVLVIMFLLAQGLAMVALPTGAPGRPAWLYWGVALGTAALFLASLLAHELAHALVARHYGIPVRRVTLWLLGGVAELDGDPPTPTADLRVAAVGPLTSAGIGGVCFAAALAVRSLVSPVPVTALAWLATINLLLAVFNMIPAAPLDGGRVLRAALWRWRGDRARAVVAAARAGSFVGGALVVSGLIVMVLGDLSGLWLILVGWFVAGAARAEERAARVDRLLGPLPVRAAMDPCPPTVADDVSIAEFVDAVAARSRHRTFFVVDAGGHPVGTVDLESCGRFSAWDRRTMSIGAASRPVHGAFAPDLPLSMAVPSVLSRLGPLPVVDGEVLVGQLAARDIERMLELTALGVRPGAHDPGASSRRSS